MAKKKILIIVFSVLAAVVLAILATLIGLNYKKIEAWFNGARVYTYEEVEAATLAAYNKGLKENEAIIKQIEDLKKENKLLKEENAELIDQNSFLETSNIEKSSRAFRLEQELQTQERDNHFLNIALNESRDECSFLTAEISEYLASKYNLEKPNDNCVLLSFSDNRFSYPDLNFDNVVEMPPVYVDVTQEFQLPAYNGTAPEGWTFSGWAFEPRASFLEGYTYDGTPVIVYGLKDEELLSENSFNIETQYYRFYAVFTEIEKS